MSLFLIGFLIFCVGACIFIGAFVTMVVRRSLKDFYLRYRSVVDKDNEAEDTSEN
jgi:hypothetical protein